MGAFFTNIHVQLAAEDTERQLATLSDALSAAVQNAGYRVAESTEQPDRTILIGRAGSTAWAVVYDEDSDAQDLRALEHLARAASADHIVLSVLVNDSDELVVTLFRNGRRADRLRFNPAEDVRPRPKSRAWRDLLGDRFAEFEQAFASNTAFAEDPLNVLTTLLGWDERYSFLGFSYRDELPGPLTELRFVLRPEAKFFTLRNTPPDLRQFAERISVRVTWQQAASGFGMSAMFYNEGGAAKGLTVMLALTPELQELIEIDGIRIQQGDAGTEMTQRGEVVSAGESVFLRAQFPDATLHAWPDADRELTPAESFKINRVLQSAKTTVTVLVRPKRTGSFTAELYVLPHENPREGRDRALFALEIHEKPWWSDAYN